ncbi:hypothetical protein [Desulfonema ishimotonii]|uniref:hypothetical protein n=1 Tax=Desulfonema ishimotonii TaxID=45657 RepID=UPI000F55E7AB|nr:hypothetical protein [Desulfonema ishimotonii]
MWQGVAYFFVEKCSDEINVFILQIRVLNQNHENVLTSTAVPTLCVPTAGPPYTAASAHRSAVYASPAGPRYRFGVRLSELRMAVILFKRSDSAHLTELFTGRVLLAETPVSMDRNISDCPKRSSVF